MEINEYDKEFLRAYYEILETQEKAITKFSGKIVDLLNEHKLSFRFFLLANSIMGDNLGLLESIEKSKNHIKEDLGEEEDI